MLWAATARVAFVQRRPAAIVNLALLLELAVAALPPGAEDEIVLIEHLPGRRVHLQDFFWTGVEDAPSWLDPNQILTLYETHTIHHTATVYVPEETPRPQNSDTDTDSRRPIDCPSCIEPTPTLVGDVDQNIGVLLGDDPGPRYWLLTVLKAGESVPSKVELRLAKLYKTAFTRQQQRHLGLMPEMQLRKNFPKREAVTPNHTMEITQMTSSTSEPPHLNETQASEERMLPRPSLLHMRQVRISKSRRALPILDPELESEIEAEFEARNETRPQARAAPDVGLVQVRLHNTSLTQAGATRLVYTVHLGGKPVPAETAAKDMALLTAQEVALELGAPVLIQSEPLSRKRDAWLLIGATSAGLLVLLIVVVGLLLMTKHKRVQSSIAAPSNRRTLIKDEEYAPSRPGLDNRAYTPETEARTEVTSEHRRTTPRSQSMTPGSQDTLDADARDVSTENEAESKRRREQEHANAWNTRNHADIVRTGAGKRRVQRGNGIERPRLLNSANSTTTKAGIRQEILDSLEKGFGPKEIVEEQEEMEEEEEGEENEDEDEEATGSPHSYLSMPSCKEFPNMRTVEPLSKVLEPGIVKPSETELENTELKGRGYDFAKENEERYFSRASSAARDPGVLGPIVWDLKRKRAVEGNLAPTAADLESGRVPYGPVGRARRRLNELLEDSFSLFGSREAKHSRDNTLRPEQPQQPEQPSTPQWQRPSFLPENRGKSAQVSHVVSPRLEETLRPSTSLPRKDITENIPETGQIGPHPRGAWGSRPLSAGPFHRPTLPEVDVVRVLADSQLRPEDPAVPLIAAIREELKKFSYE